MDAAEEDRRRLGQTLKRWRLACGLTGAQAARRAEMSQPKISRLENAVQLPTSAEVATLAAVYRVDTDQRDELAAQLDSLSRTVESSRTILRGGAHRKQAQIAQIEAGATQLRFYQPATIPGLLQTAEFTRRLYGLTLEGEALVKAMRALHRRQAILYEPGRHFTFVLTEQALRWRLAPDAVMVAQLHHIASLSTLSGVSVGVIPWTAPVSEVPLHGFELFDDRLATVGLETATLTFTDPADLRRYQELFTLMLECAVHGEEARAHLARIAADHQA